MQIILSNDGEWLHLFEILERVSHYFGQPFVLEIVMLKKRNRVNTICYVKQAFNLDLYNIYSITYKFFDYQEPHSENLLASRNCTK